MYTNAAQAGAVLAAELLGAAVASSVVSGLTGKVKRTGVRAKS